MPPEPSTPLAEHPGLQPLDYAAVVLYLLVTFGIAVWFGRKQKNTEDFFVGGRRMPWLAVGLSILATLFSTISYLGVPGEVIKNGIALFCGYLAIPFTFLVIMYLWVPFFMRLRLTSAYEYLDKRFNYAVRLIGATLFIFLRLGWMSMVTFVASLALDRIKGDDIAWLPGPDLYWWIAGIGIIAAVYTSIGGIQAVIWVDVIQCLLLLAGVLMTISYVVAVDGTGPADWWRITTQNAPQHTTPPLFSLDFTVRLTIITAMINNFFWTICTHGSDQVVLQRYFSTSSLQAARRSYLTNLFVDFTIVGLLSLAGLALLAFYVAHPNLLPGQKTPMEMADKLFPHFLGHQLPAGCAGLIMSAFLCDAIQTLESGVNGITAVVVKDFLTRTLKSNDSDLRPDLQSDAETGASSLRVVRWLAVVIALLVAANACLVAFVQQRQPELNIVDMMPKFFNMFVGPLSAMFFIGMFLPRCSARSVIPAVIFGISYSVFWSWCDVITGSHERLAFAWAIAIPCMTTFFTAALLGMLIERRTHGGSNYTWWGVVRGKQAASTAKRG
jgi:solute:Na+ symporter, SSS family